jgi:hypothetical protein
MEKIDWTSVTQEAGDQQNIIVPLALDCTCPYCNRNVHFKVGWTGTAHLTYVSKARCSGCQNSPVFVYVVPPGKAIGERRGELFIYPFSKKRKPYKELSEIKNLPHPLKEEYESLIRIFNMQEWISASVMCRRLLEGILQQLIPETEYKKPLHKQILIIDNYTDLKKPIKDIADVLRIAGNKGAHFNPEDKPNREILELMLDLIDYLIEYFYVLPDKTNSLKMNVLALTEDNK